MTHPVAYAHNDENRPTSMEEGVNSRAELVTLTPGLRPERRFAPLARGKIHTSSKKDCGIALIFDELMTLSNE